MLCMFIFCICTDTDGNGTVLTGKGLDGCACTYVHRNKGYEMGEF